MNKVSALWKVAQASSLATSAKWDYSEKMAVNEEVGPQQTTSAGALLLDSPASRTVRNKCLVFISHEVYGIFVIAAGTD